MLMKKLLANVDEIDYRRNWKVEYSKRKVSFFRAMW